jgi:hypothetical protein
MKGHDRSPETAGYAINRWRERGSSPMVRTNPADASNNEPVGELAQLVERCDRTAEVRGSSPLFSIAQSAGRCQPDRWRNAGRQDWQTKAGLPGFDYTDPGICESAAVRPWRPGRPRPTPQTSELDNGSGTATEGSALLRQAGSAAQDRKAGQRSRTRTGGWGFLRPGQGQLRPELSQRWCKREGRDPLTAA